MPVYVEGEFEFGKGLFYTIFLPNYLNLLQVTVNIPQGINGVYYTQACVAQLFTEWRSHFEITI